MTRVILFASDKGDVPANLAFTNNFSATADPGVGDDSEDGYTAGSVWINATSDQAFLCTDATAGAAVWSVMTEGGSPGQVIAPAASTPTGAGSAALLRGGAGGATSGAGGAAQVTGGAAVGADSAGGSVVLTPGAKTGTGKTAGVIARGVLYQPQGAPAAKTVSATLTAAELLSGIITVTQGAGAPSAQQAPNGTAILAALPTDFAIGDSFDVSIINLGAASEVASLTVNTDVTIVGNAAIPIPATGVQSTGVFRFRMTAAHVFVAYRVG